jgi:hypothetical protein
LIEKRTLPFVLLFAATTLAVIVLQYRGWQAKRETVQSVRAVQPESME